MKKSTLAIDGGIPVRQTPLPPRKIFGESELEMVKRVFKEGWDTKIKYVKE